MAFTRRALQAGAILGTALTVALTGATTSVFGQASTPPAARVFGTITVNGANAANGAVVTAYNGNTLCGTATGNGLYNGSVYFVDIDSSQPACSTAGTTLSFKVNGTAANETVAVPDIPGSAVRLNLTVSGGAAGGSASVTYAAGWNLVGTPGGMVLSQAASPLYTYPSGATDYTQVTNTTGLQAGTGYWAYFNNQTTVTLSGSATLPVTVNNTAGGFVMIGNPSPTKTVSVSGAEAVYTYNAVTGYQISPTMAPGQGAWAYCSNPCTITIQ